MSRRLARAAGKGHRKSGFDPKWLVEPGTIASTSWQVRHLRKIMVYRVYCIWHLRTEWQHSEGNEVDRGSAASGHRGSLAL